MVLPACLPDACSCLHAWSCLQSAEERTALEDVGVTQEHNLDALLNRLSRAHIVSRGAGWVQARVQARV